MADIIPGYAIRILTDTINLIRGQEAIL
jgi:hypothetical protein